MNNLQICLYRGGSSDLIPLYDFLSMTPEQREAAETDLEWITWSIVVDGVERFAFDLSLGPLRYMVPQLLPAAQRLLEGKSALLRSGVLDVPEGYFLLFEPDMERQTVLASIIVILDDELSQYFPNFESHAEALYSYVAEHRDALVTESKNTRSPHALVEVPLDYQTLLHALDDHYRIGTLLLRQYEN